MQANHTNEVYLDKEQTEKLLTLLAQIEDADQAREAIWYTEKDRQTVADIRHQIKTQTGRN